MTRYVFFTLLLLVVIFAACSSEPHKSGSEDSQQAATAAASPEATPAGAAVAVSHGTESFVSRSGEPGAAATGPDSQLSSAGGIKWRASPRWELGPERPMRVVTYLIPAASGDREGAECAVFYFGPGQGGGVEANLTRWIGQFEQPDGRPSASLAKKKKEAINGLPVTTIDLTGTYLGGGPMMGQGEKKPGYRLLGAIVEAPEAAVFFKLTGPAKTVAAAQSEFQSLLKSLSRE